MTDASVPKNIAAIGSEDAFSAWLLSDIGSLHVLFCFTEWHEPSMPGGAMDVVFTALAERYPGVEFAKVICARGNVGVRQNQPICERARISSAPPARPLFYPCAGQRG